MRRTARANRRNPRAGSSMLEFTLAAIPMIFVLISTFEIARGMWIYGTVANAVKEGTRFAIVKGSDCSLPPNACSARISDVATRIQRTGRGLLAQDLTLSFSSDSATTTCRLDACLANHTVWPPAGDNAKGQPINIVGQYQFRSAMAMFWPGAGKAQGFGEMNLNATSRGVVEF